MNTPPKEIIEAAKNVKVTETANQENLIAWLKVISNMSYESAFTNSSLIESLKEDCKLYVDHSSEEKSFLTLYVSLTPERSWEDACQVVIRFEDDFTASIDDTPFTAPQHDVPEYLEETAEDILGFNGTWEEVIRKWITLVTAIANHGQEAGLPSVPEDLT